jgi:sensor histidine kinase YesM
MQNMVRIFYLLFLLLEFSTVGFSQKVQFAIKNYGKNDGLPSNVVYTMCQDKTGYLWIGTDAGVSRYNGEVFENFTIKDGLPSNDVLHAFCDSKNRIWFVTYSNKICYFFNGKIWNQNNDSLLKQVELIDRVGAINEDNFGTIYFCDVSSSNIWKLSKTEVSHFKIFLKFSDNSKLKSDSVMVLRIAEIIPFNNSIYVITNYGVCKVLNNNKIKYFQSSKKIEIEAISKNRNNIFVLNPINNYFIDSSETKIDNFLKNKRILNNNHSLYLINDSILLSKSNFEFQIFNYKQKTVIANQKTKEIISCFFKSNRDEIYFGSLTNGFSRVLNYKSSNLILEDNHLYAIYKYGNKILFGNSNSEIFSFKYKESNLLGKLKIKSKNQTTRITKILDFDKKREFFAVCTDSGPFIYNSKNNRIILIKQYGETSSKDCYVKDKIAYFIFNRGIYIIDSNFKTKNYYFNIPSTCITYFKNEFYISSLNKIYLFRDSTLYQKNIKIPFNSRIIQLLPKENSLIILTAEEGIYELIGNKIFPYLKNNNLRLPNTSCTKILLNNNQLYVASKSGIHVINATRDSIKSYYQPIGLGSEQVNDLIVENDTLYATTNEGLSIVDLKTINKDCNKFDFFFNPIVLNNQAIKNEESIEMHSNNILKLGLNKISFSNNGRIKVKYRIDNGDWIETQEKEIVLSNLEVGNHLLEAFAMNSYEETSAIISKKIMVTPRLYEQLAFKVITTMLAMLLIIYIIRVYIKKYEKKEIEKREQFEKVANLELQSWRSNINPHYIFNSLNAMQSIFNTGNFETGNSYLIRFSKVLRSTIDNSNKLFISIKEEVAYLTNYLNLEKLYRKGNLNIKVTNSIENSEMYYIPTLLIQPVIENSLKHGIAFVSNPSISIEIAELNSSIIIIVADNGKGMPSKINIGKGIGLIKQKIDIIKKMKNIIVDYTYENMYDENNNVMGVKTKFTIPKITKNNL